MQLLALIINIAWLITNGFISALLWVLLGALLCITIIGIPFGIAAFRIAGFVAWPFGRTLVDARDVGEDRVLGTGIAQVIWVILAGIWLFIGHMIAAITMALTLIGIPFAIVHFKLALVSFAPLGKRAVATDHWLP
ncbi:MAG: YccF domain-containing protein [Alphaproteobacteria bacterium]